MSEVPGDSAGQAWAGKSIPSHGFAGDTGGADPALVAALAAGQQPRQRTDPREEER